MTSGHSTLPPHRPPLGVARDPVSVHDLHATMLHQLGIDHQRLTYKFQGLDFKLTGVEESRVVKKILA